MVSPLAIVTAALGCGTALLTLIGTAVSLGRILARLEHLSDQVSRLEATGIALHDLRQTVALLQQRQTTTESTVSGHDRALRTLEHALARHTPDPEAG